MPGLSTIYVLDDETINMKTWSSQDDELLPRIKFARQNGVPLAEYDPTANTTVPGALVNQWGAGNWSGSADAKLRSLRAGACFRTRQLDVSLSMATFRLRRLQRWRAPSRPTAAITRCIST